MKNVKRNLYDLNFIAIKAVSYPNINVSQFYESKNEPLLHSSPKVFAIFIVISLDATYHSNVQQPIQHRAVHWNIVLIYKCTVYDHKV